MKMKDWKMFGEGPRLTAADKARRIASLAEEISECEAIIATTHTAHPETMDSELIEDTRIVLAQLKEDLAVLEESVVIAEEEPESASQEAKSSTDNPNYDLNKFSSEELEAEIKRLRALLIVIKNADAEETHFYNARIEAAESLLKK